MIPPNIAIGDTLIVREGSGPQRRYFVSARHGTAAPELLLVGVNGARRKLIETDGQAMLVRELGDGSTEGRRVTQVVLERQVGEDEDGEPLVVRSSDEPDLAAAIEEAVACARAILDRVPVEFHGGADMSDAEVDRLGRVSHGTPLISIAMVAACDWIDALDMALGQIRSLAKAGELGNEPMSQQSSRHSEAGCAGSLAASRATPDSVLLDVAAELARLGRLQSREIVRSP